MFPNSRSKVQSLTTSSKQPLSFTCDRAAELTFKCYSKVNVKTHKNITERKEKRNGHTKSSAAIKPWLSESGLDESAGHS